MGDAERTRTAEILLVEDDPGDILLTREMLKDAGVVSDLAVVENGIDAIAYLRRTGRYAQAVRPDIILLDLNLPKKDGREVLAEIKQDPDLRLIPVIVLTTSRSAEDITRCYDLHANCYITKPLGLEQFGRVVRSIGEFWFSVVTLPPKGDKGQA
jgi:CheY-like chemotaxis protein